MQCNQCKALLESKDAFKDHLKRKHKTEECVTLENSENFNCTQCNFTSNIRSEVKRHINIVHKGIRMDKCSFCDFTSYNKTSLKVHFKAKHEECKFLCNMCNFQTSLISKLI